MRRLIDKFMPEGAAALAAQIEAEKRKGSEAYAAIERLEDERRGAETFEAARAIDDKIARLRFEIGRIDRLLPELEERLADANWDERQAAFEKHRKLLIAAGRKSFEAVESAARANVAIVLAKQAAREALGSHANVLFLEWYGGILVPDAVAIWRRHVEAQLAQMEKAQMIRPGKPQPLGPPQAPSGGRVALVDPAPAPMADPPAKAAQPAPAAPQQPPAPAPAPRRAPRHDGAPGPGQRQVHIVAAGDFNLPDGSRAKIGDRINLTSKLAEIWAGKGVAEFVDTPEPGVGDLKATVALNLTTGGAR